METISVRLRFLTYSRIKGIVLPSHLCRDWGFKNRQRVAFSHGQITVHGIIIEDKKQKSGNQVKVTSPLKEALSIPHTGMIHLKYEDGTIRVGPSIGIITTGIRDGGRAPIGPRSGFFQKLLSAQKGKGVYYFIFSPNDVDWSSNRVYGWFLRSSNKGQYVWKRFWTAMPDVLYDRVPSRAAERQESVKDFKSRVANENYVPMFNIGFFDKWGVHQRLYPMPEINEFIPETQVAPTLTMLKSMLDKYSMVYLKPKDGSLGYGILKIKQLTKGYQLSYHSGAGNVTRRFQKLPKLYQHVFQTRRASNYLIQQGIDLCTYSGRPLDFRVHLHKNVENSWVVSCIAAKVAGVGSVTTHVRTGGRIIPGKELLETLFPEQHHTLEKRVREASIRLANAIEFAYGTNLGELGLDIGIDKEGNIWMFEANSKPGRSIFKHARLKQADEMSRSLLVDYSRYLANF
ncbi:YheC/YheD family protein [Brevibacillus laterosporus]|uniref:Endospore coat-associated protein n=1 Tax=Brevibacillus laterosporus TaxID=1465 RepID=A0AAP8QCX2_BRELA|nr:YheC/YheD family protein [Brevibacillus laterosporus]MCR8979922.1 YheC/YheD family protein [Brevibacillus laterosporus]MCZ0807077.1 YheC/YheD family protein [Brevibacillus laterosporus]MCZ0826511.1 YheC/YheD family protein [Brevibacillus laterosporus]MCZ0850324.1 YheC/YheD family protein [Brevibacillus laterosporus]MED1663004.1 YheC/YheD family protein [Brevibacillus laterosporus]